MPQRVDAFAHVFPRSVYEKMLDVHPTDELQAMGSVEYFWDVETRIRDLDEFGIDKQVLTLARPPIWLGMDDQMALELTRFANNAVREYADQRSDRFIPVGTVPRLSEPYADEAERCLEDLDMAGIQIFSNSDGRPIDSLSGEAILSIAEEYDAPVWIHPQLHEWHEWDEEFMLHKMLGWPFDTSLAMCRLVFSGILERHPDLQIIPHHMGAMIPHFANRIEDMYTMATENPDVYPYSIVDLDQSPIEYLSRFYGDTVRSGSARVLESGLEFYGEDNLVFGTDYPFGPENGRAFLRDETDAIEEMRITRGQRQKVFGENLLALIE